MYKILQGDTLEKISKKIYGTGIHDDHILRANPGLTSTLIPGTTIAIPKLPDYPGDLPQILGIKEVEDVQVYIDGNRFEFWTDVEINLSLDSIDSFVFSAPFDPYAPGFRELFKPFTFKKLILNVGKERLITGVIVGNHPSLDANSNTISVSGYATPGILHDCNMPINSYPIEYNTVNLRDIAKALTKPFGVDTIFKSEPKGNFEQIVLNATDKIFDFLAKLAKQKNFIMSNNEYGALTFFQAITDTNTTVADLSEGKAPLMSITPNFNEQEYYSHVTGLAYESIATIGDKYTIKNPFLKDVIRPFTYTNNNTTASDLKTAVEAKAGRMFAEMVSYSIEVSSWHDQNNDLWRPNTVVSLYAPRAMIYEKYYFVIRSVFLKRDKSSYTATLELVLPGSLSGIIPTELPWG